MPCVNCRGYGTSGSNKEQIVNTAAEKKNFFGGKPAGPLVNSRQRDRLLPPNPPILSPDLRMYPVPMSPCSYPHNQHNTEGEHSCGNVSHTISRISDEPIRAIGGSFGTVGCQSSGRD